MRRVPCLIALVGAAILTAWVLPDACAGPPGGKGKAKAAPKAKPVDWGRLGRPPGKPDDAKDDKNGGWTWEGKDQTRIRKTRNGNGWVWRRDEKCKEGDTVIEKGTLWTDTNGDGNPDLVSQDEVRTRGNDVESSTRTINDAADAGGNGNGTIDAGDRVMESSGNTVNNGNLQADGSVLWD